jgi:hypothetical protein
MEVRDIIKEALNRANIVPRRQAPPFDKMETGLKLLKGIASAFNNDNYLAFTQCGLRLPAERYIHIFDEVDTQRGEWNFYFDNAADMEANPPDMEAVENHAWAICKDNLDRVYYAYNMGEAFGWTAFTNNYEYDQRYQQMRRYAQSFHIHVEGVAKLNTLNVDRGSQYGMYQINFLPRSQFDSYINNDLFWTWTEGAEGEWMIEVKPYVSSCAVHLKLDYNRALRFDIDTDLRIPDAYVELLTVALTHKLAVKFPRVDDAQMQRLENAVTDMLSNVRTPKADARQVLRDDHDSDPFLTATDLMRGRIFY